MSVFDEVEYLKNELELIKENSTKAEIQYEMLINNNRRVKECIYNKLYDMNRIVSSYSIFDLYELGSLLSILLSKIEDREYAFKTFHYRIEKIYNQPFYKKVVSNYNVYFLSPKYTEVPNEEEIITELESDVFDKDEDIILIKKVNLGLELDKEDEMVNFYDTNGNRTINTKRFESIYELIDTFIDYKIENDIKILSYDESMNLLNTFLNKNTYKKVKSL